MDHFWGTPVLWSYHIWMLGLCTEYLDVGVMYRIRAFMWILHMVFFSWRLHDNSGIIRLSVVQSNCIDMSFSIFSVVVWCKNNLRISILYDYLNSTHCIKRALSWWDSWQMWQFLGNWRESWSMSYHRNMIIIIRSYCVYVLYITVSKYIMKCSY